MKLISFVSLQTPLGSDRENNLIITVETLISWFPINTQDDHLG